jgi:endoplasmic reticulum lectin 1
VTPLKAPPLADGQEKPRKVPTLTFNERVFPYYGVSMYGGTPCDLEGMNPRQSVIKYICKPSSPNQIVSLLETTTCEYEVIVQTPLLCDNPAYVYELFISNRMNE